MDIDTLILETDDLMQKTSDYLQKEFRGMRTGRATTALLEYVKVEYYGSHTDLRELAIVNVADATQLMVKPFVPSSKNEIVKAIEAAGVGARAQVEGNAIRVSIPAPSSDRRKQLVVQVKKLAEESKIAIRNERRDCNKAIEGLIADKKNAIPEDAAKKSKEEVDEMTKKYCERIDELAEKKVTEIEEV